MGHSDSCESFHRYMGEDLECKYPLHPTSVYAQSWRRLVGALEQLHQQRDSPAGTSAHAVQPGLSLGLPVSVGCAQAHLNTKSPMLLQDLCKITTIRNPAKVGFYLLGNQIKAWGLLDHSIYIYISIYIYVYIYVYVHTYTHTCVCIPIHRHMHM